MIKTSKEIREEFLKFFEDRGHLRLPSFSLIPKDPTLLFTAAGMVPLKSYFLGEEKPPNPRITTCQACIRTNDIEQVGKTIRHHTFFEMLGNFSIGDYFKEDAIPWAYELVTKIYGLPKEKLWVSVYPDDDEAYSLWRKIGIPEDRIVKLEDNFWQMGEEGPCGPDSEIYFDLGEDFPCERAELGPAFDCDRFLEIWNLVFTQFDRKKDGTLTPLPRKNIDTGMGLERITMVLEGKRSNFETDLFSGIIEKIGKVTGKDYKENIYSFRVIADHIRAVTFLISEGLFPSNEGRGYVLRRLIRRSFSSGWSLGLREPFLFKIYPSVVESLGDIYPLIKEKREIIEKVLVSEEKSFINTLSRGLDYLTQIAEKTLSRKERIVSGKDIFFLYDTYGFPKELAEDILSGYNLTFNKKEFEETLKESRKKSRVIQKESGIFSMDLNYIKLKETLGETKFTGYTTLSQKSKIIYLLKNGQSVNELKAGEEGIVILDKTPFYGEKGGQVGDKGKIYGDNFDLEVIDTKHPVENFIIHLVRVNKGSVSVNSEAVAEVDYERRKGIQRAHTATHLLHKALREVLGEHALQKGSLVDEDYLRFDFSHFSPLEYEEIKKIEDRVVEAIYREIPVNWEIKDIEEAKKEGAVALFGEKYGEKVRVVSVEGLTKEFCGGTHVSNTMEIGIFKIISEKGIGSNLRRIEAYTGKKAFNYMRELEEREKEISGLLGVPGENAIERIKEIKQKLKEKDREYLELKKRLLSIIAREKISKAEKISSISFITVRDRFINPDDSYILFDEIKNKIKDFVLLVVSGKEEKNISIFVSDSIKETITAKSLMDYLKTSMGVKGGGRDNNARGRVNNSKDIEEILRKEIERRIAA